MADKQCCGKKLVDKLRMLVPCERFRNPPPVVAVLRLAGVIGESKGLLHSRELSLAGLEKIIDQAFEVSRLKALALVINSPGGSPVQAEYISRRIHDLATEKNIPVISFVEDVAASGGYWLACTGEEIFASRSSIIGSIGVIAGGFGMVEVIKKIGLERRVYTQGDSKNVLDPFLPEKEKDVEILQSVMKDSYEEFTDYVRERRKGKLRGDEKRLFSGEFWSGRTALELGLIDGIGDIRSVMRARYGDKVKLVKVEKEKGFLKRTLGACGAVIPMMVEACVARLEARVMWSRFGL